MNYRYSAPVDSRNLTKSKEKLSLASSIMEQSNRSSLIEKSQAGQAWYSFVNPCIGQRKDFDEKSLYMEEMDVTQNPYCALRKKPNIRKSNTTKKQLSNYKSIGLQTNKATTLRADHSDSKTQQKKAHSRNGTGNMVTSSIFLTSPLKNNAQKNDNANPVARSTKISKIEVVMLDQEAFDTP